MSRKTIHSVSVVSANYNNASFLKAFFDSVLNSSVLPGELVIADDGSTDQSAEIISAYAEQYPWIVPVFLEQNQGVAHATNRALKVASGNYVLRVDPDDLLMPHRIEEQYHFLESHSNVDILGGNCWYVDAETESRITRSNFPTDHKSIEQLFHRGENGVLNGTTMVRSSWFENFHYRQEKVWAEDYDLFARMLHAGARFAAISAPNTLVRIHRKSATSNLQWDTIEKAYLISRELFGNKTSLSAVRRNFKHLLHYRRFLLDKNPAIRSYNLLIALFYRPDKLMKRLLKK